MADSKDDKKKYEKRAPKEDKSPAKDDKPELKEAPKAEATKPSRTETDSEPPRKRYDNIEDVPGIGPATAAKLKSMGIHTVEALATATIRELETAGVGDKQAAKVIAVARDSIAFSFRTLAEIQQDRANIRFLKTGVAKLDDLLGGGLETQTITEFYGEYGSGKSILCHELVVNVQLPEDKGGLNGAALYIDTEHTFRPEWIQRICKAKGLDFNTIKQKILVADAWNSDHQALLLDKADEKIRALNVRLIVVDSLTAHFRSEYLGREMLAPRQQKLNAHLHKLARLAQIFNAAAVVTNQVMAKPDQFFGGVEAIGGHIVSHTTHTRVFLRKARVTGVRICKLISSSYMPEGECLMKITGDGIVDTTPEDEDK